jgi:hypothetical protein
MMLMDAVWRLAGVLSGFADWLAWLAWSVLTILPMRAHAHR